MPPVEIIHFFRACRPDLRVRWEQHLRSLPPSTAMATPDALVHLMDWTLQRVEAELCAPHGSRNPHRDPICPCGLNPLTTYFITAENATVETLFADTAGWVALPPSEREDVLRRLRIAIQRVALREVEAFCAMCKQRDAHAHPLMNSTPVQAAKPAVAPTPLVAAVTPTPSGLPPSPAPRRAGLLPQ
jgi:hypothetical protein